MALIADALGQAGRFFRRSAGFDAPRSAAAPASRDFLEALAGPPEVVDTSPLARRRDQVHHLLHVRLPLRHPGASQGRQDPLHRRQPRPSGQQGRALRQGLGRHHAALFARASCAKPLLRVGERGSGEFEEIEWDEALATRHRLARRHPQDRSRASSRFFTGRDQSQALTGWWAKQFGTPNFAAHGGFCSVNMAAAGLYTIGGSFWEFGEPDWEHTRYFMLFGVAEDHDFEPDQDRPRQAQGATAPSSSRSTRSAPATRRSPTNGSASGPAPTACSSAR